MITLYFGPVVNPQTLTRYDALPRCLIAVGSDGNIIWIEEDVDVSVLHQIISLRGLNDGEYTLVELNASAGEFIMPGLIDTHVVRWSTLVARTLNTEDDPSIHLLQHACQFPNLGMYVSPMHILSFGRANSIIRHHHQWR